jgi:hypothetical protein
MPMNSEDDYYLDNLEEKKLEKLYELENMDYFNTTCPALCGGKRVHECNKDVFKEGLCKSHYNSYKYRGRKEFDRYQLNKKHRFERNQVVQSETGPNIEYKTLEYRQALERRELRVEQRTYANSKEDDEAEKRRERKYNTKLLKQMVKEILRSMIWNINEIDRGRLEVVRRNNRDIRTRMLEYFEECDLYGIKRDHKVNELYNAMIDALHKKEDEITDQAIQQEQREIEEENDGVLERFVNDGQNVHREDVVDMVVETYRRIIDNIDVPEEYKWNKDNETTSKTVEEIIAECKLPMNVVIQMLKKYDEGETIYDIEAAYPRILDAVWQFIKKHDDKECLMNTLKTELTDNIGSCPQGNLTRLCNILSGYMEGIQLRSLAEQLGDLIPPLREESDEATRLEKARGILRSLRVPHEQWDEWMESLKDDEEEEEDPDYDEWVSYQREMARMYD